MCSGSSVWGAALLLCDSLSLKHRTACPNQPASSVHKELLCCIRDINPRNPAQMQREKTSFPVGGRHSTGKLLGSVSLFPGDMRGRARMLISTC